MAAVFCESLPHDLAAPVFHTPCRSGHKLQPGPYAAFRYSSRLFAGDWIGTGADDQLCFIRLQPDGNGTVLVSSASGDWLGARIRWRNQRQSLVLIEVSPEVSLFPAEPARRLMPLSGLTLRSGINQTLQLKPGERSPVCELQLHNRVLSRSEQAGILLDSPADVRKSDGRK
ncbi:MAG: hypothetical protein IPJ48_02755 [Propionivibrio sp.]|uniref:Uncharacterized protein n=1 Tax=Candidatus Propionivibrio dominans TaxID=2954373 RepID=A0A9D7F4X2_9RHOO|nr:hypothetical protein [Candidatus Propionivibrio dominans]